MAVDLEHMKYLARVRISMALKMGMEYTGTSTCRLVFEMLERLILWEGYPHDLVGIFWVDRY